MILAVDIGNTNIVLGCLDGNTVCGTARLATAPRRTTASTRCPPPRTCCVPCRRFRRASWR